MYYCVHPRVICDAWYVLHGGLNLGLLLQHGVGLGKTALPVGGVEEDCFAARGVTRGHGGGGAWPVHILSIYNLRIPEFEFLGNSGIPYGPRNSTP